jgi:hypothetical protein
MRLVDIRNAGVYLPALRLLRGEGQCLEDYAYGKEVIYFLEGYLLAAHLIPDGVDTLNTRRHLILKLISVQHLAYGGHKLFDVGLTLGLRIVNLTSYLLILLGEAILHAQILKLTLYGVKAPYTLLFFSNPGCDACMNIINVLKGEPRIAQMIASGQLAVLNIYIDEDLEAWRSYMPIYPDEWYNGFDPDFIIRNQELYNVRAIPSLYLLDAEKKVLLKDAPENKVFDYLVKLQ